MSSAFFLKKLRPYSFPTYNLILKVLIKEELEQTWECILIVKLYITTTGVSQTLPTTRAISYQFTKEKTLAQKTRTQSYSSPLERRQISSMQLVRTSLLNKDIREKFKFR